VKKYIVSSFLALFVYIFVLSLFLSLASFVRFSEFDLFGVIAVFGGIVAISLSAFLLQLKLKNTPNKIYYVYMFIMSVFTVQYPLGAFMNGGSSSLKMDLHNSYFISRGLPFGWWGCAHFPLDRSDIVKYPFVNLRGVCFDWWSGAIYLPNFLASILVFFLFSALLYYFLRLIKSA